MAVRASLTPVFKALRERSVTTLLRCFGEPQHNFIRRCSASAAKDKVEPSGGQAPRKSKLSSKSFVMNMFRGQVELEQLFPFPQPLNADEISTVNLLVEPTEKFFSEVNDPVKNDTKAALDDNVFDGLKKLGAFGLQVPAEYDGLALKNTQYGRLVEVVGASDLSIATTLGAHQSIGFKGILLYGTEEQKKKYLPGLARGDQVAAFCLTESTSGSDANSIRSNAKLADDGRHYLLNGSKIWISNGGTADVFTVFAKTPVKMSDGTVKDKMSAFIVERSFDGVSNGPPERKMGIKGSNTAEVYFENVKVPVENLLGQEGEGFKVAMNILNNGRFGIAAAMNGTMRYCVKKAIEHANSRIQFGRKLIDFSGVREKIARMVMRQYATESMQYMISGNMDQGSTEFQLEAAVSKIYSTESAWYVCDEALQILGGMGYMSECGLERVLRDLRITRIYEGTNDILRLFVALFGIEYAGEHLRELQRALKRPLASYGLIRDELWRRAKRVAKMTSSRSLIESAHPALRQHATNLTNLIETFGAVVETVLMKYGEKIAEQQFLLTPMADATIDMYAMAVVLSRASDSLKRGVSSAQHELAVCNAFCATARDNVSDKLTSLRTLQPAERYPLMSSIAQAVSDNNGILQKSPLNI